MGTEAITVLPPRQSCCNANLIILDDFAARREASRLGLRIQGTLVSWAQNGSCLQHLNVRSTFLTCAA